MTADYAKEKGLTMKNLSGTKFRQMLRAGDEIPTWYAESDATSEYLIHVYCFVHYATSRCVMLNIISYYVILCII